MFLGLLVKSDELESLYFAPEEVTVFLTGFFPMLFNNRQSK